MQCPRCFGRGYQPKERKPSKRNPHALGFIAKTCPRCGGTGDIPTPPTYAERAYATPRDQRRADRAEHEARNTDRRL